jgi:hypothetical protein
MHLSKKSRNVESCLRRNLVASSIGTFERILRDSFQGIYHLVRLHFIDVPLEFSHSERIASRPKPWNGKIDAYNSRSDTRRGATVLPDLILSNRWSMNNSLTSAKACRSRNEPRYLPRAGKNAPKKGAWKRTPYRHYDCQRKLECIYRTHTSLAHASRELRVPREHNACTWRKKRRD